MRRNLKKTAAVLGAAVLAMGMMAGCGSSAEETTAAETTAAETTAAAADAGSEEASAEETAAEEEAAPADLEGSITMAGSTSMEKFANALAESFMEVYPNVTVQAEFTGSSAGIEAVLAGQCDIGNSSRNLTEDEIAKGAAENIVAIDGIAIVTDAANTVSDLTKDQLIAIYSGETTNWSDLGGADQPIVVVGREAGSGTRGAFEEILVLQDACK